MYTVVMLAQKPLWLAFPLFSPVSPPTALSGGTDKLNLPTMNVGQVSSLHSVQSNSSLLPSLTQSLTNLSATAAESLWGHQHRL